MSDAGKSVISGTFGATGQSDSISFVGNAAILIEGGVGTVAVERSYDGGSNWDVVSTDAAGTPAEYTTASDVALNGVLVEIESQILYRLNCTAYTSGTINYRVAAG